MKNIKQNDVVTGCLCALGCETLYGLSYMFTKQATELASTFALLGWRFFIAVVVMSIFIFCGIVKIDLKGAVVIIIGVYTANIKQNSK